MGSSFTEFHLGPSRNLGLERLTTAARLGGVRIVENETLLLKALVPIDFGSVQIQGALFVNDHSNAMLLVPAIFGLVKTVVERNRVIQAAATAANYADPQKRLFTELMLGAKLFDLFCSLLGQDHCHGLVPFLKP